MRSKKEQQILDNMSEPEKFNRTSLENMRSRGVVLIEWRYWFLARNEFPHSDRGEDQQVLWEVKRLERYNLPGMIMKFIQKKLIIDVFTSEGYEYYKTPKKKKSVKFRDHYHFYSDY